MAVRIITDSSCDLTKEEQDALGVTVVPLSIRFGDEEFTDRVGLSVTDFYRRLTSEQQLPETAAPSPGAFEAAFREAASQGADAVVCVTLSSELSATYQSARAAAKAIGSEIDVRVVDSHSITLGLGTQVIKAAEAASNGVDADGVEKLVEDMATRTHVFGALDTLEYLKRGGRIGGAQAMLGQLLSIKPIIDISSGKVEEAAKARTRKRALQWLADKVLALNEPENLCVCHGMAPDLDEFLSLISHRYPPESIRTGIIGAVIGTHGGPRVIGVTWQDSGSR